MVAYLELFQALQVRFLSCSVALVNAEVARTTFEENLDVCGGPMCGDLHCTPCITCSPDKQVF